MRLINWWHQHSRSLSHQQLGIIHLQATSIQQLNSCLKNCHKIFIRKWNNSYGPFYMILTNWLHKSLYILFCLVIIFTFTSFIQEYWLPQTFVPIYIYKAPCPLVLFFICPCVTLQVIVKNLPLKEQHLRKEKPKPKLLLANWNSILTRFEGAHRTHWKSSSIYFMILACECKIVQHHLRCLLCLIIISYINIR